MAIKEDAKRIQNIMREHIKTKGILRSKEKEKL